MDILTLRNRLDFNTQAPWGPKETDEGSITNRVILDLTMALGTAPVATRHSLYVYDDGKGIWEELDSDLFHALVQAYAVNVPVKVYTKTVAEDGSVDWSSKERRLKISHNKIRGVYQLALRYPDIYDPEFFDRQENGIAFTNGFVKVTDYGIELRPHSPGHRALTALPYDYDPDADCDEWLDVLRRVFSPDPDRDAKIVALQEFAGACVCGMATDYQRCLVMVGGGENGKSTVAETISDTLFHREMVTHIPPQSWDQEYNLSHLKNARLNMASEIPESEILASAVFKGVITGDPCTARDPYQKPYSFRPTAGHLFSCNSLPASRDSTRGFWRRFLVLTFNRDFARDPDRTTKSNIRDILDGEASGIMHWALHGAVRLLKRREYTIPPSHNVALNDWQEDTNPVAAFLADCCSSEDQEIWCQLSEIHADFLTWAERQGRKRIGDRSLSRRLKDAGIPAKKTMRGMEFQVQVRSRVDWKNWATLN